MHWIHSDRPSLSSIIKSCLKWQMMHHVADYLCLMTWYFNAVLIQFYSNVPLWDWNVMRERNQLYGVFHLRQLFLDFLHSGSAQSTLWSKMFPKWVTVQSIIRLIFVLFIVEVFFKCTLVWVFIYPFVASM